MSSRKIEDLVPELQELYHKFTEKMKEAGLDFIVVCTARTVSEQRALYAQGRQSLNAVNLLRKEVGLPPISEQENKRKVTWTRNSKHLTDKNNPKAKAFDIVLKNPNGTVHWNTKLDNNNNGTPDYIEIGEIGESVGLRWGGRFSSPDYVHFEEIEV